MAEEIESNKKPNTFEKGLNLDLAPENQPEGTYRFALNSVLESQEGDYYSLNNEQSNYECVEIPEGFAPIGSIYSTNDERLVFLCKTDNTDSAIALLKNCKLEVLVQDPKLGFLMTKPIKGVYRLRNGCERNYYFIDGHNADRSINIDRLDIYKDSNGDWVVPEFDLIRSIKEPKIVYSSVKEGGGKTKVGVFQITARYLDEYNNTLPFAKLSEPIRVVPNAYDDNLLLNVHGGYVTDNEPTNKSFSFLIQDLDDNYPYLEIGIVETTNGVSRAYVVDKLDVSSYSDPISQSPYTYTGVETNYSFEINLTDITVSTSKEITSQAITTADNRLVRANTSEPYIDWTPFVKAALQTESKYYIDVQDWNQSKKPVGGTTFMGDEVYAFGVQWVIDDKIESPVFHIPGRSAINDSNLALKGNLNPHNRVLSNGSNWDKVQLTVVGDNVIPAGMEINLKEVQFLNEYVNNMASVSNSLFRYQIFNTAINTGDIPISIDNSIPKKDGGLMAYWESTEKYPDIKDCNGEPLFSYRTGPAPEDLVDFSNTPIRHHKMPDRTLESVFSMDNTTVGGRNLELGVARNIKPVFTIQVPDSFQGMEDRLKARIVVVPRDGKNSTVVDAGLIMLAPYINVDNSKNSKVPLSDSNNWERFVGDISNPGPKLAYNAVTTNFNCLMTNVQNKRSNANYPCDWYYTHFISPSFTHKSAPFDYSYYKLERILYGQFYMECRKKTNKILTDSEYFNPEFISSLFLTESAIPGSATPALGVVQETDNTVLTFEKKINNFPNWYYRVINSGEQIGFNEHKIISSSINKLNAGAFQADSLPESLNSIGTKVNHNYQKGFIASLKHNQWINDFLNSDNKASSTSNTGNNPSLASFFRSTTSTRLARTNAYNYLDYVGGRDEYENNSFAFVRIGGDLSGTPYGHHAYYGTIKNNVLSPYRGLDTLKYRIASELHSFNLNQSTNIIPTEYGDCCISRFDYVNTYDNRVNPNLTGVWWNDPMLKGDGTFSNYRGVGSKIANDIKFMVESPLNINLASSDLKNSLTFAPYSLYANNINLVQFRDAYHHGNPNINEGQTAESWKEILYSYNQDFSKLNIDNLFFPLAKTFDYCRECINSNKNRIYYSEKSFTEELTDLYRTYLVNNYRDIDGEFGEVVDLFNYKNNLFVDVEENRYVIKYGDQRLETDESTISIGTGDFLSLGEDRVSDSTIGFMGNQSRYASLLSEHGIFSVDSDAGNIFLMSDEGPKPISRLGMSHWFKDNLKLNIKTQLEDLDNTSYNYKEFDFPHNTNNPVGFISAYDTKYDRIILTKHDWLLTSSDDDEEINGVNAYKSGQLRYISGYWTLGDDVIKPKDRPDLFENRSWTISYSLKDNCWVGWHSYMPNYIFGNKLELISFRDGSNNFYKHNKFANFQTFYGVYHPHIIEGVSPSKGMTSEIFNHLQYNSIAKQWDAVNKQYIDKRFVSFDKAIFYNSYQNSGLLNLVTKKKADYWTRQFQQISGEAFIDANEKLYTINGFKNMNSDINQSLFTSNWNAIQNDYYIDKVINPSGINLQKDWYNRGVFRDRYLTFRLFFSIFANIRISTMMSSFKTDHSIR